MRAPKLAAPALMLASGCSMYVGASFGVLLFDYLAPAAVAWLRVAVSAAILVVAVRPPRAAWTGRPMLLAGMFGVVTALMNICFYEAIARLPMGTAVAIEFLGPIAVVAAAARSARAVLSLMAALGGVVLIADVQLAAEPLGIVFALSAAAFWAGYVVLGKAVAVGAGSAWHSLAVGWTIAALATSPLALLIVRDWRPPDSPARAIWLVAGLALLSSVVPYVLDQVMLTMVDRATFALLLALLPVSAVAVGFVALAQVPTATELAGIALVVLALAISDRAGGGLAEPS